MVFGTTDYVAEPRAFEATPNVAPNVPNVVSNGDDERAREQQEKDALMAIIESARREYASNGGDANSLPIAAGSVTELQNSAKTAQDAAYALSAQKNIETGQEFAKALITGGKAGGLNALLSGIDGNKKDENSRGDEENINGRRLATPSLIVGMDFPRFKSADANEQDLFYSMPPKAGTPNMPSKSEEKGASLVG